jgi:hypothetical protein
MSGKRPTEPEKAVLKNNLKPNKGPNMKTLVATLLTMAAITAQAQQDTGVEVLMGAQIHQNSVKILVHTGGCTWKESFIIKKNYNALSDSTAVTFVRVIPDNCEAYIPQGRVLTFSREELRLRANSKLTLANPILPN